MFFRDVITLLNDGVIQNKIGDFIEYQTESEVFADKISIKQSEFYEAMAQGIRPDTSFKIRRADYNNQKELIFNSKKYDVIRTQAKDFEHILLIVRQKLGDSLSKKLQEITETLSLAESLTTTEGIESRVGFAKVDYAEVG